MKVLFLGGNFNNSGGTERVGTLIANGLSNHGYEVLVASITEGDKPFYNLNKEIRSITLTNSSMRTLYRTPLIVHRLRRLLIEESIDILIVIETMSVLFTLPATIGLDIKHICWEHFNFKNDLGKSGRRLARQLAAHYCDSVVTLTDRDKDYWLQNTYHKNQIIAIPNPSPYEVQSNVNKADTNSVLAVGRLNYIKGFDLLLQAWTRVAAIHPKWQLTIVGEGNERPNLEKIINDNNLHSNVCLVGNTNEVHKYYNEAKIFCLSSRYEGFPMVLLEALSFGLPIVSFDCDTGPAEILENIDSILVPPGNTDLLAQSLIDLIENKEKRELIGSQCIRKAEEYQPDKILKQWINLIESII